MLPPTNEAVALFAQRARAVKPDFALMEANAAAAVGICACLDGLPLALELAAARLKLFPPQTLLARLGSRLKMLTGGARDLPTRQQTLRGAIDWSYSVLEPCQQRLFARLSVFARGCSLESIELVCDPGCDLEVDLVDVLQTLVDNSLLNQVATPDDQPRFMMLEIMREYGHEQLEICQELANLRRRHAEHFLRLAEDTEPQLRRSGQAVWLERLEQEHDNLRAALAWSLEQREAEIGLRLAGALSRFWEMHSYLGEGRRWLEALLALDTAVSGATRAKALNGAGWLACLQGDYSRAIVLLDESLSLWRGSGNKWGVAITLNNLGAALLCLDDPARARTLFEESLSLGRELGDNAGIAAALGNLGMIALHEGDYSRALALLEDSLKMRRDRGSPFSTALSLKNLRLAAREQGDYPRAVALLEESLSLPTELGDKVGIAYCLEQLAGVAMAQGQAERAARLLGAASKLREAISTPLPPADRADQERHLAAARAQLDPTTFATAWEEGCAMNTEQALAYALEAHGRSHPVAPSD